MERPTPPKPANLIALEGKSHRTKKELRERKKAEESLLSGEKLKESAEVKSNPEAHKYFRNVKKILGKIEKDDNLYSNIINRYCLLLSECDDFSKKRDYIGMQMLDLEEHCDDMEYKDYLRLKIDLSKQEVAYDRQVNAKRKEIFAIEKENLMTIASALRSIPKKVDEKQNPLLEVLRGG